MLKSSFFFALLESDSLSAISRHVMSMPLRQQVKIVPVEHCLDAVATAKAEMAAQNQDLIFPVAQFSFLSGEIFYFGRIWRVY